MSYPEKHVGRGWTDAITSLNSVTDKGKKDDFDLCPDLDQTCGPSKKKFNPLKFTFYCRPACLTMITGSRVGGGGDHRSFPRGPH